jgi:hypothetical protein
MLKNITSRWTNPTATLATVGRAPLGQRTKAYEKMAPTDKLLVTVLGCENLNLGDATQGVKNSYVTLTIGKTKFRTTVTENVREKEEEEEKGKKVVVLTSSPVYSLFLHNRPLIPCSIKTSSCMYFFFSFTLFSSHFPHLFSTVL